MLYTSCVDCGGLLEVTSVGQVAHPTCCPDEVTELTQQWCDAAQREDVAEANRLQAEIDKRDSVPELGPSALWYAQAAGWPVFPLRAGDKRPATRHGLKDATLDAERIGRWWAKHPHSNIGLPTGVNFDVIDVDGPVGIKSLSELPEGALPDVHGKVDTPRGLHLYVLPTQDGNRTGVRPGIDYRSVGGYVVAPPSVVDGRRYTWLMKPSPGIGGNDSQH